LDDEDREAARALVGKRKKKRVQEGAAFYQQTWFKAVAFGVPAVVVAVVLALLLLGKPSQDSLYRSAEQATAGELEDKVEARKHGPIFQYLTYYGDRDDDKTKWVRKKVNEIDVAECERLLLNRLRNSINTGLDDDERAARAAVELEDNADLKKAVDSWAKLLKYKDEPLRPEPSEKRSYGLLAEARIETLKDVERSEDKLEKGAKGLTKGFTPVGEHEKLAAEALKLELQKAPQARDKWDELQKKGVDPDGLTLRPWWSLLAAKRIRGLGPAPK